MPHRLKDFRLFSQFGRGMFRQALDSIPAVPQYALDRTEESTGRRCMEGKSVEGKRTEDRYTVV